MGLSRRKFLGTLGAAAGTAAVAGLPLRGRLLALEPRRAAAPGGPIHLDSNENAYGPAAEVVAAMREALAVANRYPDEQHDALLAEAAEYHHVPAACVVAGCGSTDVLRMAAEAFGGPGRKLVQAAPTFEALGQYVEARGGEVASVALRGDFAHDLEGMRAKIDERTTLVYLCNPNNPTASLTPAAEIEAFLGKVPGHTTVVVDEAYHHFAAGAAGYRSLVERAARTPGLIVTRTFSKVYGLAGVRVGYAVAARETMAHLGRYQLFDSLNAVGRRARAWPWRGKRPCSRRCDVTRPTAANSYGRRRSGD